MHRSSFTASGACSWLCLLLLCALSLCSAVVLRGDQSDALERKPWMDSMERQTANDPYISELVNRLRALKEAEEIGLAQKRGLDFGMGRGFSGSLAAKHLMGLAAASYPGGPGRRRRSAPAVPSLL